MTRAPAPLAQRQLTATGRYDLTMAAVREMTGSFGRVTEVVAAAENVWDTVSEQLDQITAVLDPAQRQAAGLGDAALAGQLAAAADELRRVRSLLSSDPLSLWRHGRVDTTGLDRLQQQAQATAQQVADLARLAADADRRIAAAGQAIAAARVCEQDARAAYEEAGRKIAGTSPPLPPGMQDMAERVTRLDAVKGAGRWIRLASELDLIEQETAAVAERWRAAERAVRANLDRRRELRGLLDA